MKEKKKSNEVSEEKRPGRPVRYTQVKEPDYNQNAIDHKTDTLVYAMGGLGEIGKNMYCFEHDDEIIIVDCGVLFPEDDLLGVDYVIPDFSYLVKNQQKIKALIITHGHEDHIGGIPFFLQSIHLKQIYAPRFAKSLIEKKLEEHRLSRACKIVEINNHSFETRKGSKKNCAEIARLCKKYEVPVVVNTDAHFCTEIGHFPHALAMLEEIDFPERLVVNADYDSFLALVREKSGRSFTENVVPY